MHADNELKEETIERIAPTGTPPGRYQPPDRILAFLDRLSILSGRPLGLGRPRRALAVHDRRVCIEPNIDPRLAVRAHRDALLVVRDQRTISCPSSRARSATPRSSSPRSIAAVSTPRS